VFEVEAFPDISTDELFQLVVSSYFTEEELHEARLQLEEGRSYAEVVSVLAECAQKDLRRRPCCLTIPGGNILAHPPNQPKGDLSHIAFQLIDVVRAAFPPLSPQEEEVLSGETLWGTPPVPDRKKKPKKPRPAQGKKMDSPVRFIQIQSGKTHEEHEWVAKMRGEDLGLGYRVIRVLQGEGYRIELVHQRSKKAVAEVYLWSGFLDHAYIRQWVCACLSLPSIHWMQSYPMIVRLLPEQHGRQTKRKFLASLLEVLWETHKRQACRVPLFEEIQSMQ
jgi:hypothetical protein